MDRLLFLTYCATNSLFYVLIKQLHLKYPQYPTYEIAAYSNMVSLLIMMWYPIKHYRKAINGFKENLKIAISAPSAILKFMAISSISPKNAMVISFLTPIAVTVLSFITLKERVTAQEAVRKYGWMMLSFAGVTVFIGADFAFAPFAYTLMLIHIMGKAFFHIFTKQLSKDRYLVLFYGVLYNLMFSASVSLIRKGGQMNLNMALNPQIIFIGTFSVLCQFALIQAYKMARKISNLQNLDYSRILFSSIGAYVFLAEPIKGREWIGMLIIMGSVFGSQARSAIKSIQSKLKPKGQASSK